MKKICIVAGARPNFIKVAPVIRAIRNAQEAGNEISYQLVYTGKEDDPTLESSLFDDLGIQKPDAYLGVDCPNMNELTGQVMGSLSAICSRMLQMLSLWLMIWLQPWPWLLLPRSRVCSLLILQPEPAVLTLPCQRKSTVW